MSHLERSMMDFQADFSTWDLEDRQRFIVRLQKLHVELKRSGF